MTIHLLEKRNSGNAFIDHLAEALSDLAEVTVSPDLNDVSEETDILHIHWPETLTGWQAPSKSQLLEIERKLNEIKGRGTHLVWTRHNTRPHSGDEKISRLYELVERQAEAVIHLGPAGVEALKKAMPHARHTIIPHGMYKEVHRMDQAEARAQLGLTTGLVVLIPGRIRTMEERQLIKSLIEHWDDQHVQFLIPRWKDPIGYSRLAAPVKRQQERALIKHISWLENCRADGGFVDQSQMDILFSASDVVVIPRLDTLNSGLLYLAFSYGKAVLGPDHGNIGHYLQETGNFCFSPGSIVRSTIPREEQGELGKLGAANRAWVLENGDWKRIGEQHVNLYNQCLQSSM